MQITTQSPSFSTTAQLQVADLSKCAARGFTVIVNNRPDGEERVQPTSSQIAAEAERLGLGYAYLPIVPGQMTDLDARSLGDILCASNGPALAFCRTGNRSEQLWHRASELGLLPD
ncbi:TIGR01244 family sulfur transferase [Altererythrobacter sp. ZODW24]|uniref:TIGR01244 family sulfur transferase n=1 Tax=Altererythrobacter sp. ZODW24 TaxID=2185142 RepID=UPI000DF7C07F|nr:TIGR01244 family sulfur transferase [Altererythrobacter sp. ZODW24]